MGDVDNLTDAELRTKLMEFGFPIMPITGTTRKVMTKKLKYLMENQGKSNSSDRRSLGKFSSDEESDNDAKLSKKDKSRRVTMAVTPMQQPMTKTVRESSASKDVAGNNEMEPPAAVVIKEKRKSTARTAKIIVQVQESPDHNSDSEPEIVETDYKQSYKIEVPVKTQAAPVKKATPPPPLNPPSETISPRPTTASPSRYSVYSKPSTYDSSGELDKIRKRLSLGSRYVPKSSLSDETADEQTPFLSNFTRQLSQMSQKHDVSSSTGRSDPIKEHDTNGSMLYNRSSYLARPRPREYARTSYGNTSEAPPSKGANVSVILIAAAGLFFVVLAALYYGLHSGSNSSDIEGLSVPYCQTTRDKNCLTEMEANGAIEIYKIVKPLLITHAIRAQCEGKGNEKFYMTDDDIVSHIKQKYRAIHESEIIKDIDNFIILLFKNSFLGVSVLQVENGAFTPATTASKTLDDYFDGAQNNCKRALVVLSPTLPWKCSLLIKFAGFVRGFLIILMITTTIWFVKYGYKWYKYYEQRRKEEMELMVEKIIDFVHTNAADDKFVVINHVRDMLIPVNHRKNLESVWQKAQTYINENESRIRTEVQIVKGEQYEVWRWLGGMNVSPKCNKSWQGQAFETQAGSPNSPPCSPSPCLKIRGMVDEGDRNLHIIRESVLVKCGEQCCILHCAVDPNSKCVYLKCADTFQASVAYKNLHGWWYASHLVTVKYLRDERYMQRFPDSPRSGPPFLKAHSYH